MSRTCLAVLILVSLSFLLIFYKFNQIPKNLAFDEVEFAKLAISLEQIPYIPYSPRATGHSTLYFYIILTSFKIFGVNNFGLRFPAALFGVLNIIVVFFIYRFALQKMMPFFLSLIFLTLRWYFNFARFSFEATFLLFLELLSILSLFLFFEKEKFRYLFLSGLFAGLAFNSYLPGRIFFLLPLFFFIIYKFKFNKPFRVTNYTLLISFLLPLVFLITPLTLYLYKNPDIRISQQLFLANKSLSIQKKGEFLAENLGKTALMFNFKGDLNGRHNYPGKPALNLILGSFFGLGLIISFLTLKNFHSQFFIAYFLISLFPTILTYPFENPHMLRTFTVTVSLIFFIGQFLNFVFTRIKPQYKKYALIVTFVLLAFSVAYEIRTYFKYQALVFEDAFEVKEKLEQIDDIKKILPKELL